MHFNVQFAQRGYRAFISTDTSTAAVNINFYSEFPPIYSPGQWIRQEQDYVEQVDGERWVDNDLIEVKITRNSQDQFTDDFTLEAKQNGETKYTGSHAATGGLVVDCWSSVCSANYLIQTYAGPAEVTNFYCNIT